MPGDSGCLTLSWGTPRPSNMQDTETAVEGHVNGMAFILDQGIELQEHSSNSMNSSRATVTHTSKMSHKVGEVP